jgi:hypothetical protein
MFWRMSLEQLDKFKIWVVGAWKVLSKKEVAKYFEASRSLECIKNHITLEVQGLNTQML